LENDTGRTLKQRNISEHSWTLSSTLLARYKDDNPQVEIMEFDNCGLSNKEWQERVVSTYFLATQRPDPTGEFLSMYEGRALTTNTFNRRLKRYCEDCDIPYLSSHKIRFTGASMLRHAGVDPINIQPLLGHSTLAMTQHYISEKVDTIDTGQMATILM